MWKLATHCKKVLSAKTWFLLYPLGKFWMYYMYLIQLLQGYKSFFDSSLNFIKPQCNLV